MTRKTSSFPSTAGLSSGICGRAKEKIDIGVQFKAKLQWQSRKTIEKAKDRLSTLSSVPHPASSMDTGVNMATAETAESASMMMLFCPKTQPER